MHMCPSCLDRDTDFLYTANKTTETMITIRPKLLSVHSSGFDFTHDRPTGIDFCEWLEIEVTGEESFRKYGGEVFGVFVCTPAGLAKRLHQQPHIWGHKYLIVPSWSKEAIEKSIHELCEASESTDWGSVVAKLSRYLWVDTVDQNPDS